MAKPLGADRPTAVPAQPAAALHDELVPALGTSNARRDRGRPRAGDEHLSLAAPVAIDGDSLAAQLVRELVRSFHISRSRGASEVDRLADRGVDVPLKRGLHPDVSGNADLVRGGKPPL